MSSYSTEPLLLTAFAVTLICLAIFLPPDVTIVLFAIVLGLAGLGLMFTNAIPLAGDRLQSPLLHRLIGLALTLLGIGFTVWYFYEGREVMKSFIAR